MQDEWHGAGENTLENLVFVNTHTSIPRRSGLVLDVHERRPGQEVTSITQRSWRNADGPIQLPETNNHTLRQEDHIPVNLEPKPPQTRPQTYQVPNSIKTTGLRNLENRLMETLYHQKLDLHHPINLPPEQHVVPTNNHVHLVILNRR